MIRVLLALALIPFAAIGVLTVAIGTFLALVLIFAPH